MATLKESQKQARMKIAATALRAFHGQLESAYSILELFVPDASSTDAETSEILTAKGRKWQKAMMQRLEHDGIVKLRPDGAYAVRSSEKLRAIINSQDHATLAQYVFGYQTNLIDDDLNRMLKLADGSGRSDEQDETKATNQSNGSGGQGVEELFQIFLEQVGQNHKQFDGSLQMVLLNSNEQLGLTHKLTEQVLQRERNVGKRIDELDNRLKDTQRVVESMQTTLKAAFGAMQSLNQNLADLSAFSNTLKSASEASLAINAKIDALIVHLNRSEQDKLGKLMPRLDVFLSEGSALRDLFLQAIEDKLDGEKP